MRQPVLISALLMVICFSLAAILECWFENWPGNRRAASNALVVAVGESRTLLANYFHTKADVYFLSGCYSTIYDDDSAVEKQSDWVDDFGRNFRPSIHTHLDDGGHAEEIREIFPWLRLAVEMDPTHVESYLDGSFMLRKSLARPHEAERFLRDGLRANPNDPALLFELGHLFFAELPDASRASALWSQALRIVDGDPNMNWAVRRSWRNKLSTYLGAIEDLSARRISAGAEEGDR